MLWILGASDPEMERIEQVLSRAGERLVYGMDETRKRVAPSSAYRVSSVSDPDLLRRTLEGASSIYLVECDVAEAPEDPALSRLGEGGRNVYRIDHHRPGDPGYGRPPAEFLAASAIGQVISVLASLGTHPDGSRCDEAVYGSKTHDDFLFQEGRWFVWVTQIDSPDGGHYVLVPEDYVFAAAADQCLAAAYRRECPGVDPDDLMEWRIAVRASFQQIPEDELMALVRAAMEALEAAPKIKFAGVSVADMRERQIPEIPEASARLGIPFLGRVKDPRGGMKVVLQSAPPEAVQAFLNGEGFAGKLVRRYGDPARGFAGGFEV